MVCNLYGDHVFMLKGLTWLAVLYFHSNFLAKFASALMSFHLGVAVVAPLVRTDLQGLRISVIEQKY